MAYTSLPAGASALHEEKPPTLSDLKNHLDRMTSSTVAIPPEELTGLCHVVTSLCDAAFDVLVKAEHVRAITSLLERGAEVPVWQRPIFCDLDELTTEAVLGLQTLLGASRENGEV
jgi:hypothetical protein